MKNISDTISKFDGISLSQMDEVKLMNRTDQKYWFEAERLVEILDRVSGDYFVLEVCEERLLPYSTTYYDTSTNDMYANHHRGKMNRYKIRRRNYLSTQSSFLEVKFKNNKGRTIKSRHPSRYDAQGFDNRDCEFIACNTPYDGGALKRVLENRFRRITLVSRGMNERCTIDLNVCFEQNGRELSLSNLVIVEVKRDGRSHSDIVDAMSQQRISPSGFSKYCIGRSFMDESVKINTFKRKHRMIEKITNIN